PDRLPRREPPAVGCPHGGLRGGGGPPGTGRGRGGGGRARNRPAAGDGGMSAVSPVGGGPAAAGAEGLLLVGHGSRSGAGAAEMLAIGGLVGAALRGVEVDVGFLEMTDPPAGPVLDGLAAA